MNVGKTTIRNNEIRNNAPVPFGLHNAAQTFQRFMDSLLKHLPFVCCYLDDIIIASNSLEEHIEHLRQIFTILQENGLQINPAK